MGATVFETEGIGATTKEAYAAAVEQAFYDHGHSGYTGTIAEKAGYREFTVPKDTSAGEFADLVIKAMCDDAMDELVAKIGALAAEQIVVTADDKWGPAVALKVEDGKWLFFGWASC